jgi:phage repressor protein C with HTH and peptisase S24 domain
MFPFGLYRVQGESMLPTFNSGDLLIGRRWFINPKIHDVVVVRVDNKLMIKRIKSIDAQKIEVVGDNTGASTDSRSFGPIDLSEVRAKILTRNNPPVRLEK